MNITRRLLGGVFAAALASISFSQVTFAGTAQELGADYAIIGRSITKANHPVETIEAIK